MDDADEILGSEFRKTHFAYLGSMTQIASSIELTVEMYLLGLLGSDQFYGGAAVRWISFNQQTTLIRQFIKDAHGEESEIYKNISKAIKLALEALDIRNHHVHSMHNHTGIEKLILKFSAKRGKFGHHQKSISLDDVKSDLERAGQCFDEFVNTISNSGLPFPPPSSPYKDALKTDLVNLALDHNLE